MYYSSSKSSSRFFNALVLTLLGSIAFICYEYWSLKLNYETRLSEIESLVMKINNIETIKAVVQSDFDKCFVERDKLNMQYKDTYIDLEKYRKDVEPKLKMCNSSIRIIEESKAEKLDLTSKLEESKKKVEDLEAKNCMPTVTEQLQAIYDKLVAMFPDSVDQLKEVFKILEKKED